jgi:hypothetical protein
MITDIIDFLPIYTDIQDKNFNMNIYSKKEFYDNKLDKYEETPKEPGILLRSQKIISNFLSSYTPYDNILLAWKMGVGKTGAAISVIEKIKMETKTFTGALIFAKGDTILENFKDELVNKATKGQYIPENFKSLSPETQVTRINKLVREYYTFFTFETFVSNEISGSSDEYLIEKYSNKIIVIDEVHNIRLQDIKNKKIASKNKPVLLYQNFHRFLHLVKNCKIILLSGTPIKDSIEEISSVMNLILPIKEQLPIDKEFLSTFFNKDEITNTYPIKPEKIQELKNLFKGRVSYLEPMKSDVKQEYIGKKMGNLKHFIVYPDYMSEFQSKSYINAYEKDNKIKEIDNEFIYEDDENDDDNENTKDDVEFLYDEDVDEEEEEEEDEEEDEEDEEDVGEEEEEEEEEDEEIIDGAKIDDEDIGRFSTNSRQASLFVFPDGTYGKDGFEPSSGWILQSRPKNNITNKNRKIFKLSDKFRKEFKGNTEEIIKKIQKFSSKYASLITNILQNYKEGKSSFIYNEYVEGSGGILLSLLLNLVGFSSYNGKIRMETEIKPMLRYAIINNKVTSSGEVQNIKNRFNSDSNIKGEIISVIIGSKVISEGISLKNVQSAHILTPHWNYSETLQAIARGYRFGSHNKLIEAGIVPEFKIYQYVSMPNMDTPSIDLKMYEISEIKDINIKQIEQLLKESSIDCSLTYKRNYVEGFDNERECNYTSCKYECDNIDMSYIKGSRKPRVDLSSYQVYYNEETIDELIDKFKKEVFRYIFEIDFNILVNKYKNEYTSFDILTSLRKMINDNISIYNKYNIQSYLREDNNIFFLVDSISSQDNYMSNYYNKNLIITQIKSYNDIISKSETIELPMYIQNIFDSEDLSDIPKIIEKFEIELQEILLEYCFIAKERGLTNNTIHRDKILEYFDFAIENIEGKTISTLLYFDKQILRCYTVEDGWQTCNENLTVLYKEHKKQKKDILKRNEFFGTYSDRDDIKKFCIVKSNFSDDKREENSGRKCFDSWDKPVIFHLIVNVFEMSLENILSPEIIVESKWSSVKGLNRKKLIQEILKNKYARICTYNEEIKDWEQEEYTDEILEDKSDDDLKKMLYCTKITRPQQCEIVRLYFKEQGILDYDATCGTSKKQKK